MSRIAYCSNSTKLNEGKIEGCEIKRFQQVSQSNLPSELKDEERSNGRIWTDQAVCLLSARLQQGKQVPSSAAYKPLHWYGHVWADFLTEVCSGVACVILHLSSTESGVENCFPLQESSGSRGQRRKNSDGGEKRNTSFPCGHHWPISELSPGDWRSGSPLFYFHESLTAGLTHGGIKHTRVCLCPRLLQVSPQFTKSLGKFAGLGATSFHWFNPFSLDIFWSKLPKLAPKKNAFPFPGPFPQVSLKGSPSHSLSVNDVLWWT